MRGKSTDTQIEKILKTIRLIYGSEQYQKYITRKRQEKQKHDYYFDLKFKFCNSCGEFFLDKKIGKCTGCRKKKLIKKKLEKLKRDYFSTLEPLRRAKRK